MNFDTSILKRGSYTLLTQVHGREVRYHLTGPDGKSAFIRGMLTRNLVDLRPQVWVPASLQERFGGDAVIDATLIAWGFAEGIEA